MNRFSDVQSLLLKIHKAFGDQGLVGFGLRDGFLVVTHSLGGSSIMLQMTFDGPNDFNVDEDMLINTFVEYCKKERGE